MSRKLLEARGKTHGSFATNAKISQAIKALIAEHAKDIPDVQREALDMIALKLSRIVSGKANVRDHWIDLAGYATLASQVCDED
jgi:hypothetical protein